MTQPMETHSICAAPSRSSRHRPALSPSVASTVRAFRLMVRALRPATVVNTPGAPSIFSSMSLPACAVLAQSSLVKRSETVLLVAHGNTFRAIIKAIEGISDDEITDIDLPQARPLVYRCREGKFTRILGEYRIGRPLR